MAERKSRKAKDRRAVSCITLHDSASMSIHGVRALPRGLLRTALALLGVCSSFAMLFGFMTVPIHMVTFYIAIVSVTLFFSVMLLTKRPFIICLNSVVMLILLLCCYCFRTELLFALGEVLECLSDGMKEKPYIRPQLEYDDPYTAEQYLTVGFCLFGAIVSFIITVLTVYRPKALIALALLYGFLGVGLFNGLHTDSMAVFCWLAYLVGTFILNDGYDNFESRKSGGFGFFYSNRKLIAKPDLRFIRTESLAWCMAILVIVSGACSCAVTKNESLMHTAHRKRMQVRHKWSDFLDSLAESDVFGHLSGQSPSDHTQDTSVALANRGNPKFEGETVFSASVISSAPLDTLYLKTSTYSVYSGTDWQPLPDTTYDIWDTLFKTMNSNQSVPQAPIRTENEAYPLARIWYSGIKTYPSTYRMLYDDTAARYLYDCNMLELYTDGTPMYRFEPRYLTNSDTLFSSVSYPTASAQDYYHSEERNPITSAAWEQYDSFARVNYLQLPYSTAMNAIRNDASDLLNRSYNNTAEALYAIRSYIHSKTKYTLTPEIIDGNSDFAAAFLLETGEGYCVHYATAGVLLCRMMNIPARFATGYVLFGSDINSSRVQNPDPADAVAMQPGESLYLIDVPDFSSHAWTEVYLSGYGWMPFEFTESYVSPDSPVALGTDITTSSTTTTTTTSTRDHVGGSTASSTLSENTSTVLTSANGSTQTGHKTSVFLKGIYVFLIVLFCAAAVIALYLSVHHCIYMRREEKMNQSTPNLAAGAAYALLLQVLAFAGIVRKPQQSHEDFARVAETICPYIPKGAMQHAVDTQMAVTFSRDGITQHEAVEQVAFVRELIQTMYEQAPAHKRFVMRWLYHWVR